MSATKTSANAVELLNKTRVLLALWDLGDVGTEVKRGALRDRIVQKGQKIADYQDLFDELGEKGKGAIAVTKTGYTLFKSGVELLGESLNDAELVFPSQAGAKTINALLRWIREMGEVSSKADMNEKVAEGAIASYEDFKSIALEAYDRLNRDYNFDNLVPIYRIRREIGDRVSRSQFNDWMLELQANDMLEFSEGTVEDSAPDKLEDSITTKLGKLRCYAKRLSA